MSSTVSIITYNLWYSRAIGHARKLLKKHKPDFLAVQEIKTDEDLLKLVDEDYEIAEYANSFMQFSTNFGNALYYNRKRYRCTDVCLTDLPRGVYEFLIVLFQGLHNSRTTIYGIFEDRETGEKIHVFNVHLSHIGTAEHKLNQLKTSLNGFTEPHMQKEKIIIVGDFNFYSRKRELENFIETWNLQEATNKLGYTFKHFKFGMPVMTSKLDYVLYRNLKVIDTHRVEPTESDHFPIFSTFTQ